MAATDTFLVNSPATNTQYGAPNTFEASPTNGTTITATVKSYNSSGVLTAVSSLTAIITDAPGGTTINSFTGNNANTASVTATAVGGTNYVGAFKYTNGSTIDHITVDLTYTGSPYAVMQVYNGSSWVAVDGTKLRVYDGSSWNPVYGGVFSYNGSAWVQV